MAVQPPDAKISDDGHYWWDESARQWQLVEAGQAGAGPAAQAGQDAANPAGQQSSADPATQQSSAEPAAGDSAQSDVAIEGACLTAELSDADIEQILAAAGATLDEA